MVVKKPGRDDNYTQPPGVWASPKPATIVRGLQGLLPSKSGLSEPDQAAPHPCGPMSRRTWTCCAVRLPLIQAQTSL